MRRRFAAAIGLSALAVAVVIGVGAAALVPDTADAQGQGAFNENSIRGTWGFSAQGTVLAPDPPGPFPAAAVGIMEFSSNGDCSITDVVNFGGAATPVRTSTECTFTVNPDGMGTILAEFPGDPGPTPLSFVIVDNKRELQFIRTDAGVARGVAKRQ